MILLPTGIVKQSTTIIDYIYCRKGKNIKRDIKIISSNIYSDLSDHLPVYVLLVHSKRVSNYTNRPRLYKQIIRLLTPQNKQKFKEVFQAGN